VPLAARETTTRQFLDCVLRINACLAVTIHRFSDYFQEMHQRRNIDYAHRLEAEVRERTAELRESESRYKTLVEEINDGYFVIQDGTIVFANNAFCKMHECPLDLVLGYKFQTFVAPESREKVLQVYHDSLADRPTPRALEYLRLTSDNRTIPTELTAKVTTYQDVRSNIGLCRDISERVKMERRMREAERMADVGRITASLSHEIRNPLSAVQLNLQVLKANRDLTGNDARRLDIAVREVGRLEGILKELLDFAKPLTLHLSYFRLEEVIETCLELLDPKFQEKDLGLRLKLEDRLPPIIADREKLGQALINLLLNSIESTSAGGVIRLSCLRAEHDGKPGIEAAVADPGHGVKVEHMGEIFKPFFTTKNKGAGLGLTNVKRIVEAHQGWVLAKNIEPRGALFRIWLPGGEE
jgi:PAS domain S-box-containing protein